MRGVACRMELTFGFQKEDSAMSGDMVIKKKHKGLKIFLIILGVIVIAAAVFAIFQWNNIKALTYYLSYSKEKIADMSAQNEQAIAEAMSKVPDIIIRDLTEEERQKLRSEELSPDDVIELIIEDASIPLSAEPYGGDSQADDSQAADSQVVDSQAIDSQAADSQARLAELLAGIYVLRASFLGNLENLKSSAIAEYRALPSDGRGISAKLDLGLKYMGLANGLEGECDARMDALLAEIEDELRAIDGDLSLVSDIRSIYSSEKSIRKAEYLSLIDDL